MPRTVHSKSLENRTSRLKLPVRAKPTYTAAGPRGLHLGYRRLANRNGTWIRREYLGDAGRYQTEAVAEADDYSDADGARVLDYYQALTHIGGMPSAARSGSYTVTQAIEDHVRYLRRERKGAVAEAGKLRGYVLPYMGDRPLVSLTAEDLDGWKEWAVKHRPAKRKGPKGREQSQVPAAERLRRRKETVNRVMNGLKAALTRAHAADKITSNSAWAGLRRFKGTGQERDIRLSTAEAQRLINAAEPGFRELVQAALLTGCRYAELATLRAADFDSRSATITVQAVNAKSSKSRRVPLTAEGRALFDSLSAGKKSDQLLLLRADGAAWGPGSQRRPMLAAIAGANLSSRLSFHSLRHSYASLLVEAGTPLAFVAEALGHSDTRMVEKHYAHLAPNLIHDAIRANLPTFGVSPSAKVRALRPKGA